MNTRYTKEQLEMLLEAYNTIINIEGIQTNGYINYVNESDINNITQNRCDTSGLEKYTNL